MNVSDFFKKFYQERKKQILEDFFTFLRFPTIATDSHYREDVRKCADWLQDYLKMIGLDVEMWKTNNAPILFASDLRAGPEKKTLLIYGHYDVQPIDPLEEWISPPFVPTIRDHAVYARGAVDDKGQCFYTIAALHAWLQTHHRFPLNIKFLIEGEEESGSQGLEKLLSEKQKELQADYLLIVDSGMHEITKPTITLGARGLVCLEVKVQEASIDLHSGMAGGLVYNPNRALVEMLAQLFDSKGRVQIPHFYDSIQPLSDEEKKALDFSFDPHVFKKQCGCHPINGIENSWLEPTLEINGIWGGYTGPGFKTVIPASAHAKLSCRLVPNQDPHEIANLVSNHIKEITPKGLQTEITIFQGMGAPFRASPHSFFAKLMRQSYADIFQQPIGMTLGGGSIPIVYSLSKVAGAETVLVGFCLPDDYIHAPNERFGLDRFEMGFLMICRTLELFDEVLKKKEIQ